MWVLLAGVWMWLLFTPMAIITVAGIVLGGWLEFMVMVGFLAAGLVVILVLQVLRSSKPEWFVVAEGVSDCSSYVPVADTPPQLPPA